MVATEVGAYSFRTLLLPLFTRLSEDDVKTHEVRGRIYQIIISDPGIHFREIQREYGKENIPKLHTGGLCYHLDVLLKNGFLKSSRDGHKKRFYKRGMQVDKEFTQQILEKIQQHYYERRQGITVKVLSEYFAVSPRVMRYNLAKISNKIKTGKMGNSRIYYPMEAINI